MVGCGIAAGMSQTQINASHHQSTGLEGAQLQLLGRAESGRSGAMENAIDKFHNGAVTISDPPDSADGSVPAIDQIGGEYLTTQEQLGGDGSSSRSGSEPSTDFPYTDNNYEGDFPARLGNRRNQTRLFPDTTGQGNHVWSYDEVVREPFWVISNDPANIRTQVAVLSMGEVPIPFRLGQVRGALTYELLATIEFQYQRNEQFAEVRRFWARGPSLAKLKISQYDDHTRVINTGAYNYVQIDERVLDVRKVISGIDNKSFRRPQP